MADLASIQTTAPPDPWAALAASQNPLIQALKQKLAQPPAPEPTGTIKPDLGQTMPPIGMEAPKPRVIGPKPGQVVNPAPAGSPAALSDERSRLLMTGSGVSQIKNPIGHALAETGNTIGGIVAPGLMARIPGTEEHHQLLLNQNQAQIGNSLGNEQKAATTANVKSEIPLHEAQTKFQETTANLAPGEAASREALQGAQAENLTNPPDQWKQATGVIGPNGEAVEYNARTGELRMGGEGLQQLHQPKPNTPEQQFLDEYHKLHPNATLAEAVRAYTDTTQRPPQTILLVPGKNGGMIAQNVKPGQEISPNAISPSGLSSINVPTSSTRTMVETAPRVIELADRSEQLIGQQLKSLGPMSSRWSEFMAGKVGAPNAEFTKLRTNIGLLQTALMRMHVGARGGEQIMEHFQDLIDSSKQDPQNLVAALDEIKAYANQVKTEGRPPGEQQGTGSAGFKVRLKDAMALPQNKGKTEAQVRADVKAHGGEVVE